MHTAKRFQGNHRRPRCAAAAWTQWLRLWVLHTIKVYAAIASRNSNLCGIPKFRPERGAVLAYHAASGMRNVGGSTPDAAIQVKNELGYIEAGQELAAGGEV